jgi:KaiC/GvpD/RAD55 family RecA-like ATPase
LIDYEETTPSVEELSKKVNLVMKRLDALGDVILVGNKVYMRVPSPLAEQYLDRKSRASLQAKLILDRKMMKVGEDLNIQIELVNEGKTPIFLTRIEEILPASFELISKPNYCEFDGGHLSMSRRKLNPSMTDEIDLTLRPMYHGTFALKPRVACFNGAEGETSFDLNPVTVDVLENVLPDRVSTGYGKLDSLLLGGIPKDYAVILTSISCDERDVLIERFLEEGAKQGEVTIHVTIDASSAKTLVEEYESNFYLFLCNPQADAMIKTLPNVVKLKGVENLTEISIALTSAFRKLDSSLSGPRRACIDIVSDVLLQHGATQTRRWLTSLIPDLKSRGFTTLAIMNPFMHPSQEVQAILDLFEGEISISERDSVKFLKIRKMHNQRYFESEMPLKIQWPSIARKLKTNEWSRF